MTDGNRAFLRDALGIRTDIDLRRNDECVGMDGSPLGKDVERIHVSSGQYEYMSRSNSRASFEKVFRVFLDERNYPIDFHCAGGQDRTGSLAFILNGLLGVAEDDLLKDWESTVFWNPRTGFSHEKRMDRLMAVFDAYPGATVNDRIAAYVKSVGFTDADIARFRELMLEK